MELLPQGGEGDIFTSFKFCRCNSAWVQFHGYRDRYILLQTRITTSKEAQLKTPTDIRHLYSCNHNKWLPLSNCRWQNRKERPNPSINNGDMVDKAKHDKIE